MSTFISLIRIVNPWSSILSCVYSKWRCEQIGYTFPFPAGNKYTSMFVCICVEHDRSHAMSSVIESVSARLFCLFSSRQKDIKNTFPVTCATVKICNIAICPFVSPSVCPSDWGIRRLGGLPFPSSSMELDTELTFVELGITRNKNRAYFVRFSISIRFGLIRFCWYFYFQYVVVIAGVVFFLLGHRRRNRRRFSCNYYSNKSILFG